MSTAVRSAFDSSGSVADVFAVLSSTRWVDVKAERFGDGSQVLRHEERPDGGVLLVVSRRLPAGVPSALERFLPKDGRVSETFDWAAPSGDGSRHGTWRADIAEAPARLGGAMRLEPTDGGSRYTIEGEVKVGVPVVGGKAERFIAGVVELLAAKEHELLVATL